MDPRVIYPSMHMCTHPGEDSIGQLIEQYPGSDKRTARRNSAQWCHLVLVRGPTQDDGLSPPQYSKSFSPAAAAAEEVWITIICCICINVIALSADSSDCNYKE